MKTFKVAVPEIHVRTYKVMADSPEEAKEMVEEMGRTWLQSESRF